jgi:hypothetical protein
MEQAKISLSPVSTVNLKTYKIDGTPYGPGTYDLWVNNPVMIEAYVDGIEGTPWSAKVSINHTNQQPLSGTIKSDGNDSDSKNYYF